MPHEDEHRSAAEIEALQAAEAESDPLAFVRSHEQLRREVLALREDLQTAQAERTATRQELDQQAAEHRAASEKLRKQLHRAERRATKLGDDIERVRGSRTFRVGTAVLRPATLLRDPSSLRRPPRTPAEQPSPAADSPLRSAPRSTPSDPADGAQPSTDATSSSETTTLEAPPTGSSPAAADLPEKGRDAIDDRTAEQRLLERATGLIPPRASGAVFPPESDRLMYCAWSGPDSTSDRGTARVRHLADGLRERGTDVHVVHAPRSGSAPETSPTGHDVLEAADALTREALRRRPAVIHSVSDPRIALPALIAARRVGVPFVHDARGHGARGDSNGGSRDPAAPAGDGMEPDPPRDLDWLLASEADAVLAATPQVEAALVSQGVARARIALTPHAVDGTYLAPLLKDEEQSASCGVRTDVPVIGALGWSHDDEEPATLLAASALLTQRGVEHQLVIAGPRPESSPVQLPEDSAAVVVPASAQEDLPRLLSMLDIVILPGHGPQTPEAEVPTLALDAMASMKTVLLPDIAAHRALAGTAQDRALLFHAGDAEALADSLAPLLREPDLRRGLGRAGRLWVLDTYPWDAAVATVLNVHHALCERPPSPAASPATAPSSRPAASMRVGLIADEFTTRTLSASLTIVPLQREGWREQLVEDSLDLVLVESAWEGNEGQWHRGVGDYGPAEHQDIQGLLATARELHIPTAFWNKEDPVHFRRFRQTAALCDHVFTTDADMIPQYLSTEGAVTRTASSMPFFAQPALHNPLPTDRPYRHTVAYAGTYYGDRYPERSAALYTMLASAARFGLTIYDRQAANPESPYQFPADLSPFHEGALPYDEVGASYKTHLAHLNANSVTDSPTMFSRRVVEIAASGGVALSGPGRGVQESFGGLIPVSADPSLWRTLLHSWAEDPLERVREAWRQMRAVHRSHTVDTALTIMLRTMGFPAASAPLEDYSLVLARRSSDLVGSVLAQSWRPREVFVPGGPSEVTAPLDQAGIHVRDSDADREADAGVGADADADARGGTPWIGLLDGPVTRTWFEDLLLAPRFGTWSRIDVELADGSSTGRTLASYGCGTDSTQGLVRSDRASSASTVASVSDALRTVTDHAVRLLVAGPPLAAEQSLDPVSDPAASPSTVLIAGHDLKFADGLIAELRASGHTVLIDRWSSHTHHEEQRSRELLAMADVVFCEWGLGNAVWYSKNIQDHQRLIVRVHLQELDRPFLRRIQHSRVDEYVFVGELVRRAAVTHHGVPAGRSTVIPNAVDVDALARPKVENAPFHLGFVGMVPRRKRLDLAVDLLERLLEEDSRFRLFVKGRLPEEYEWMAKRPEELAYYRELLSRIGDLTEKHPGAVQFDPHGDDMPEWYRRIGIAVSVSDTESFHFTLADGAASGALPAALAWPGADFVYPRAWLSSSIEEMAASILARQHDRRGENAVIRDRFSRAAVLPPLVQLILRGRGARCSTARNPPVAGPRRTSM